MYYIIYGLLYLISLLPFWVIYLISDVAYGIIYYIVRYRRRVVDNNLALAFPEKTVAERQKIAKQFYKNFTDNFIETIKLLSISKKNSTSVLLPITMLLTTCMPLAKPYRYI